MPDSTKLNSTAGAGINSVKSEKGPPKRANEVVSDSSTRNSQYTPLSLSLATISFMSAAFLVALDYNIIATAIPKITSEFGRLDHVSWYGAGYSLTRMAFQPTYGQLCSLFPLKTVFYYANGLLIIGSIVAATATMSEVLILGRVIQGWGAAGLFSTVLTLCGYIISKQKLPLYVSVLTSMYVVASAVGPVLGGVFAGSSLSWRFCFWINLPISAISVILTFFIVAEPERKYDKKTWWEKLASLDLPGTVMLIGAITCFIIALEWGGISRPWSDSSVWGCFLGLGLSLTLFIAHQIRQKERALIPVRLMRQRTVAASCAVAAFLNMGIEVPTYLLPIFFQAAKGVDARKSGLLILPLAASTPLASIVAGATVTLTGLYVPWIVSSTIISGVGYGLLSTLTPNSDLGPIIGYQVVASVGFGSGAQLPLTAMRNVLSDDDIPMINALYVFFIGLGTSLSLSTGQSVFLSSLYRSIGKRLSAEETAYVVGLGATNVNNNTLPGEKLAFTTEAYGEASQAAMYLAIGTSGAALLSSLFLKWRRLNVQRNRDRQAQSLEENAGHT